MSAEATDIEPLRMDASDQEWDKCDCHDAVELKDPLCDSLCPRTQLMGDGGCSLRGTTPGGVQ